MILIWAQRSLILYFQHLIEMLNISFTTEKKEYRATLVHVCSNLQKLVIVGPIFDIFHI